MGLYSFTVEAKSNLMETSMLYKMQLKYIDSHQQTIKPITFT